MSYSKVALRRLAGGLYYLAACILVRALPTRLWYSAALNISRAQARILHPLALLGLYPYRHDIDDWETRRKIIMARLMENWLKQFAASRRPFHIPIRIRGIANLSELAVSGMGLVLCSIHYYLADAALRALIEAGVTDISVISRLPGIENYPVWGLGRTIPAIFADQNVLLKARRILYRGGTIVVLLDQNIGGTLQENILRLACRIGAKPMAGIPELKPNGEILLDALIPTPGNGGEVAQLTLKMLEMERNRILRLPGDATKSVSDRTENTASTTSRRCAAFGGFFSKSNRA